MEEENRLLNMLPLLPDVQCAWLLLRYCASPRANHLMRSVPPDQLDGYTRMHDDAMWDTLRALLGAESLPQDVDALARAIAFLPGRMGGLGLRA